MDVAGYHRIDQTLVAIAQIGREPSRRLVEGFIGPLSVFELKSWKLFVFLRGVLEPFVRNISTSGLGRTKREVFLHRHLQWWG